MDKRRGMRGGLAVTLAVTLMACGGDGPTAPSSGGSGSSGGGSGGSGGSAGSCSVPVGVLGCPKGLIRATLDGQPFNGGVTNGGALYTPVAAVPSLGIPAQDFFVFVAIASNNSQLLVTARAKTGVAALGANVIDPETRNVSVNTATLVQPASGGAAVGAAWITSVAGGTGTITVDSVSTTGASGSFVFTMVPGAGTPATGTRLMTGTFSVTF